MQEDGKLIAELSHQINSPLAAIRNALYLASRRTEDVELKRYLEIAELEVLSIAGSLRQARADAEGIRLMSRSRAA